MKNFTLATLCLLLSCCTLDVQHDRNTPVHTSSGSAYVEVTYYNEPACWDEPYLEPPLWCDWYDDGTTCCVWWVEDLYYDQGYYEEWCQWQDDWCWEYNGEW